MLNTKYNKPSLLDKTILEKDLAIFLLDSFAMAQKDEIGIFGKNRERNMARDLVGKLGWDWVDGRGEGDQGC